MINPYGSGPAPEMKIKSSSSEVDPSISSAAKILFSKQGKSLKQYEKYGDIVCGHL